MSLTPELVKPLEIFFSYSHEDEPLMRELNKQLVILQRIGLISSWNDRVIKAGEDWRHKIDEHLSSANIILLLISPDFIASDYCYEEEMKRCLERHDSKGARVIPIILRPVEWTDTPNWQTSSPTCK